jgi:hypothetical protein
VLYVLFLLAIVFSLLAAFGGGVIAIRTGVSDDGSGAAIVAGVLEIVLAPFGCLFALIYGRILFECVAVFFRVAEHLAEINRKTRE